MYVNNSHCENNCKKKTGIFHSAIMFLEGVDSNKFDSFYRK
jgi:hypothetical protein